MIFAIVILVILASIVATAYTIFSPFTQPIIATVSIDYYIESASARNYVMNMIDYAMKNDSIKAVVVKLDCPGGWADAVEEIYLGLVRLKSKKPVVASVIGYALSGGYYIAVSSNYIYAVPTSFVGNIGVIGFAPSKGYPSEQIVETGPNKVRGFSERGFIYMLQGALENFVGAVVAQRGAKLLVNKTELCTGSIYLGSLAVRNGMVDSVGSSEHAIEKAASLAGITQYELVDLNKITQAPSGLMTMSGNESKASEFSISKLRELRPAPIFYYVYLPPQLGNISGAELLRTWEAGTETPTAPMTDAGGKKVVLIDLSHQNAFLRDELVMLVSEIVSRDAVVRYLSSSMDFRFALQEATSLLIISPTREFSNDELTAIRDFVKKGKRLLIMNEPTRAFPTAANGLSGDFGITFGNDYLYSLNEYDGIYRNIYVTHFGTSELTDGLNKIVLYTASSVYSKTGRIAFTDNETFSSEAEKPSEYAIMVFKEGEGIAAIGDMTFLTEPYCYVEDNYRLLTNVAAFLTGRGGSPG